MSASPATIEQLASDVSRSPDAENALRALGALRQELDKLEPEIVSRALGTGASWSQIAKALGVSKQAAHRKHRHLADRPLAAVTSEPKMLVTSEARQSIRFAREEALALGHPTIGTEHILLGILRCEQSHAVKALRELGATYETVIGALQPTMVPAPVNGDGRQDGVSAQARRILEGSLREALSRREGYIGVEHILLSLLGDSRSGAVQTLEALRITPHQVRRELERQWQRTVADASAA